MSEETLVRVDRLWKRYGLPFKPAIKRLKHRLSNGSRNDPEVGGPWALRDISFELRRGDTLGVVGRNGAGKSTLLKVLANVTPPTRGRVEVRGRVFPMIELNAGLHPELTGRENVRLLGAVMGLTRNDIKARLPAIEEFSNLGEWLNRPVRTYSSGMVARLGFSVSVHTEADVLLFDEVLAVGDADFQRRCMTKMREMLQSKETSLIFVSHSLYHMQNICDRAMYLEKGSEVTTGPTAQIADSYLESVMLSGISSNNNENSHEPSHDGGLIVTAIETIDYDGTVGDTLHSEKSATFRVHVAVDIETEISVVGIRFHAPDDHIVTIVSYDVPPAESVLKPGTTVFECQTENLILTPGYFEYSVKVSGYAGSFGTWGGFAPVRVTSDDSDLRVEVVGYSLQRSSWRVLNSR